MSENNINPEILKNMKIHYTGLLKEGIKTLGGDFMSESIFTSLDTDKNKSLSKAEIDAGLQNLDSYIKKSLEKDDFYADLYFDSSYTEGLKKVDKNSSKTPSEQIVDNNVQNAINLIMNYAKEHPEDSEIQKYANKLDELVKSGNLRLQDIDDSDSVAGRATKENNQDVILIDNKDIIGNLNGDNLLKTLLHELRHTLENDSINSKAEELEAETSSRRIAKKINPVPQWDNPIEHFLDGYNGYAEASPGTYNIPINSGIAVWYKPAEVTQKDNVVIIKSEQQENLKQGHIEDHITFGNEKDENGNPLPISAVRNVYDSEGNIIFTQDYGEYDKEKKSFNYLKIKIEQMKLEINLNPQKKLFNPLGLG